jgi:RimJ/RimL family protein N-acetyltransferase
MFARTKRLTLRPGWPEDAPALAQAIAHDTVIPKLSRVPWPYTVDDAEAFLARPHGPHDPSFLIESMEDGFPRLIGGIGIGHDLEDFPHIGYWLTPDAWGRGYATEAGEAVIAIARETFGWRRMSACHFVDNPASGRVLAKLGFRPTGRVEPRPSQARGGSTPAAVFELDLAEDVHRAPAMQIAA